MIVIPSCVEGELLIRSILYRHVCKDSGSAIDVLRIEAGHTPFPTVPQIAARSGIKRLEIAAAGPASHSFRWQGIDGTQIDTSVHGDEDLFEESTVGRTQHSADAPRPGTCR